MKKLVFVLWIFSGFWAEAVLDIADGFNCVDATPSVLKPYEYSQELGFTLGKIASAGRSTTFSPVDSGTVAAVKDFFLHADQIIGAEYLGGISCSKGSMDDSTYEFKKAESYNMLGTMVYRDTSFCPTVLTVEIVTRISNGVYMGQDISAVYKPNTNPEDKEICEVAESLK